MNDIEKIKKLATIFRLGIENLSPNQYKESIHFSNFPEGCCGDASELLSKYLEKNNVKAEYVSGEREQQTHAWLEYNGYIIDITADQFNKIEEKVIVTNDRSRHSKFINQERQYIDFENAGYNRARLSKLYKNITETIKQLN